MIRSSMIRQPGRLSLMLLSLAATFATSHAWATSFINNGSTDNLSFGSSVDEFINTSGGSLLAPGGSFAFQNTGSIGTLTNQGQIDAGTVNFGIIQSGGSIGTIINSASIIAAHGTGVMVQGLIGTIINNGLIDAGGQGIFVIGSGSIDLITNAGTISAARAIYNAGNIGSIANSGLISAATAILMDSSSSFGTVTNSGTIAGNITNSAANTLTIAGGTGTVFGTLTGYDTIASPGTLGSIGAISASGDVVFAGGNQLLNDHVIVNGGAGTVTNGGNSVLQVNQVISIIGNYVQEAGATLAIGVSDAAVANGVASGIADTGYGRLIVSGSANLAASSSVLLKSLNSYAFTAGQRYVVIRAASGSDYNAGSLNYSVSGLGSASVQASGEQTSDGSNAYLVVSLSGVATGSSSIARYATTSNAKSSLNGLFNYTGIDQSLLDVFNPAVALGDSSSANRAGAQLSPVATSSAAFDAVNTAAEAVQHAASSRLDSLRMARLDDGGSSGSGSGVATGESSLSPVLWGRLFGGRARQGERDGIAGYHASFSGMLIGGDVLAAPDWRVGSLFSYARVNVGNDGDNNGSSAKVNSYGLTAYASYDGHPWYINLNAGVARQQYRTDRLVSYTGFSGSSHGSFNGLLYTMAVQAGYPLQLGTSTVTPLAGLSYARQKQGAYTESGSDAALVVAGSKDTSLKSELALKWESSLATSQGQLKPFAQLGWYHEFRATPLVTSAAFAADTTGTTAFTSQAAAALRNTAQLSLGAALYRSADLSLAARYTVQAGRGYTAQAGDITLRWSF